jgi:Polyketide cyclase / dehydrase and lipid transport
LSYIEVITECADFDVPAPVVWNLLVDWGSICDWMPGGYIHDLRIEGHGPGAIRHLVTGKGIHLSERLDKADELSGVLELSLVGPLPWGLLSYRATGKLDSISDHRSRLTWQGTPEMPARGPESNQVVKLLRKSYRNMFLGIKRKVEA